MPQLPSNWNQMTPEERQEWISKSSSAPSPAASFSQTPVDEAKLYSDQRIKALKAVADPRDSQGQPITDYSQIAAPPEPNKTAGVFAALADITGTMGKGVANVYGKHVDVDTDNYSDFTTRAARASKDYIEAKDKWSKGKTAAAGDLASEMRSAQAYGRTQEDRPRDVEMGKLSLDAARYAAKRRGAGDALADIKLETDLTKEQREKLALKYPDFFRELERLEAIDRSPSMTLERRTQARADLKKLKVEGARIVERGNWVFPDVTEPVNAPSKLELETGAIPTAAVPPKTLPPKVSVVDRAVNFMSPKVPVGAGKSVKLRDGSVVSDIPDEKMDEFLKDNPGAVLLLK